MDIPATGKIRLRTNLSDSPVSLALKDGRVSSPIVEFDFCGPKVAHDGFKPMLQQDAFDAGEMAIVTVLQARAYGKPFVLLPVTFSGRFQHHCIGYNSAFGALSPRDIESRKVGVRTYSQTTAVWVRGLLQHEYGVDLDKVRWLTLEDAHLAEHRDPPNCDRLPHGTNLGQMLLDGEIAAAILVADMPKDERIKTLIPDPHAAARDWFAREGVLPTNHMFVLHRDIARKRPDVVRELMRMMGEARALAPSEAVATLPAMGLEASRKALQMAIDWAFEQKVIPRRLSVDELFDGGAATATAGADFQSVG